MFFDLYFIFIRNHLNNNIRSEKRLTTGSLNGLNYYAYQEYNSNDKYARIW